MRPDLFAPRGLLAVGLVGLSMLPATAQDLAGSYEVMGTVTAQVGDTVLDLVVPYDRERQAANALAMPIMGTWTSLNLVGYSVDPDGRPGVPMVQVTLLVKGEGAEVQSVELFDDQGMDAPMIMDGDFGAISLESYSYEGEQLNTVVTGQMVRVRGYSAGEPVADGADPVAARVMVETRIEAKG